MSTGKATVNENNVISDDNVEIKKSNKHSLEPFKVIVNVIGCEKDSDGEIVREFEVASFPLYRSKLDSLPGAVEYVFSEFLKNG